MGHTPSKTDKPTSSDVDVDLSMRVCQTVIHVPKQEESADDGRLYAVTGKSGYIWENGAVG
jgi:hypothetical protein